MQFRGMPGLGRSLASPAGLVALGLAGVAGWWAFGHDRWVGVAAVSALLLGIVEAIRALRALITRRRRADDWLRTATGRVVPPAYAWRAAQLVSPHERCLLARSLRRILAMTRERPRVSYPPLLIAVRRRRASLEVLAHTLEEESEPVTPAGMLRVTALVTDGGGPLWGSSDEALEAEIETALSLLRAA
jgi:hypothetical protein